MLLQYEYSSPAIRKPVFALRSQVIDCHRRPSEQLSRSLQRQSRPLLRRPSPVSLGPDALSVACCEGGCDMWTQHATCNMQHQAESGLAVARARARPGLETTQSGSGHRRPGLLLRSGSRPDESLCPPLVCLCSPISSQRLQLVRRITYISVPNNHRENSRTPPLANHPTHTCLFPSMPRLGRHPHQTPVNLLSRPPSRRSASSRTSSLSETACEGCSCA